MQLPMMDATERHSELVADLSPDRPPTEIRSHQRTFARQLRTQDKIAVRRFQIP